MRKVIGTEPQGCPVCAVNINKNLPTHKHTRHIKIAALKRGVTLFPGGIHYELLLLMLPGKEFPTKLISFYYPPRDGRFLKVECSVCMCEWVYTQTFFRSGFSPSLSRVHTLSPSGFHHSGCWWLVKSSYQRATRQDRPIFFVPHAVAYRPDASDAPEKETAR